MAHKILEIACFNSESAIIAQAAGADRIELCSNYNAGGLTPAEELIVGTRKKISIPLHVIIRPHATGFIYSSDEIAEMKQSIIFCKQHNIDGVVFGVLDRAKQVDLVLCKELIELARPMSVTFHRAIDECLNLNDAVESLVDLGVNRILTSGGLSNAEAGVGKLNELQTLYGDQVVIMPGGGIRSVNLKIIMNSSCCEFHSAAIADRNSEFADTGEIKALKHMLLSSDAQG